MKKYVKYLLEAEKSLNIRFDHVGKNKLIIRSHGYKHNDLFEVENNLLKMKLVYDLKEGVQQFDKISGHTYTFFKITNKVK